MATDDLRTRLTVLCHQTLHMSAEGIDGHVEDLLAVLLEDPGDLPARMAEKLNTTIVTPEGGIETSSEKWDRHDRHRFLYNCAVCQGNVPAIVAAALSVRDERVVTLAAENATLRARLEKVTGNADVYGQKKLAAENERDRARRELTEAREALTTAQGQVADYRTTLKRTTEEHQAKLGSLQALAERCREKDWAYAAERVAERDEAREQVAALQRELAEVIEQRDIRRQDCDDLAEQSHERLQRAQQAERELTEAKRVVYTARTAHVRAAHPTRLVVGGCLVCEALVPLSAVMPSRPDDPEEIRRLAQATTESTED